MWRRYVPTVIVAGIGLTSDAAGGRSSNNVGKEVVGPVRLPFVDVEGVKARLGMMLDASGIEWEQVPNLDLIIGRCRWVAATILQLMDIVTKSTDSKRNAPGFKTAALTTAIDKVYHTWATKLATTLVTQVRKPHRLASEPVVARLCKQLHAVAWLFRDFAQGMHVQCGAGDTGDMLALGLVLLVEAAPEPAEAESNQAACEAEAEIDADGRWVPLLPQSALLIGNQSTVMMDRIGRAAVETLAAHERWNAAAHIAHKIAAATNINAIEFGYRFETLVAAAIVRFDGTVADLIRKADPKNYDSKTRMGQATAKRVPPWTENARFNCTYQPCKSFSETLEALKACVDTDPPPEKAVLFHPDNWARGDKIAHVRTPIAFNLFDSDKCLTAPLSADERRNDFDSTRPEKQYTPKPGSDNTDQLEQARLAFRQVYSKMFRQAQGRLLRLHVVLPGYAKDEATSEAPALVEVDPEDGKEVRVIINMSNYPALFRTPELQAVIAGIIRMKGYGSV